MWRQVLSIAQLVLVVAGGFGAFASAALAWEFAHGDADNSGFVDVATAPAQSAAATVPGLGSFRPGAGPVVAPDGTVYVGTAQGKLIALRPDGGRLWSRDISRGEAIVASPAISSDGSIYVIGVQKIRDNRVDPPLERITSTLHKFNSTGAWLEQIPIPDYGEPDTAAVAPPAIWRSGGSEAVIVPVLYRHRYGGGRTLRLLAFGPTGQLLDDAVVLVVTPEVVGGSGLPNWIEPICLVPVVGTGCLLGKDYTPGSAPYLVAAPPLPGAAIFTPPGGGTTFIVVADTYRDVIGYTFANRQFAEAFRLRQQDFFARTPPAILPSGHTVASVEMVQRDQIGGETASSVGRLIFGPPSGIKRQPVDGFASSFAAPTRLSDGRIVVVGAFGEVTVARGSEIAAIMSSAGRTIAPAAASRTHFFVSAEDGFVTYDAVTAAEVARVGWSGGGLNPPAIGPQGHVYAIAGNALYVFGPPIQKPLGGGAVSQPLEPLATDPGEQTTQPSARTFKPPLTANGNRLFACEKLDQDDCGKGDYRSIAKAFCQGQGFAKAEDIDVDSRRVKAEALDGSFCAKNKCKVFDKIVCTM